MGQGCRAHVEARGGLRELVLSSTMWILGINMGPEAPQQVPLPAEPSEGRELSCFCHLKLVTFIFKEYS